MDAAEIAPPPPGFELDQAPAEPPPPPAGFRLDAPSTAIAPPPAGFVVDHAEAPNATALKEFFPGLLDLSPEQQEQLDKVNGAWDRAKAAGISPQDLAKHAQAVSDQWDEVLDEVRRNRPDQLASYQAQRDEAMRQAGVEPFHLDAPVVLPKLSEADVHTLFPAAGARAVNAIQSGQNLVAGTAESFTTPEGQAMFLPGIGPAIGKAFMGQMALSVPEQLGQAAGHYAAGDTQSGDAALIQAGSTSAMLGMPLLADKVAGRLAKPAEAVQTPGRPAEDWLPAKPAAEAPSAPPAPPEGFVLDAETKAAPTETETAGSETKAPEAETVGPPSRLVQQTLVDMTGAHEPVPVSVLEAAGVKPEALEEGYAPNADGTAYEFTPPPEKLTPEQELARANVQAMAELRAAREAAPQPEAAEPAAAAPPPAASERAGEAEPMQVDVTPAEVRAAAAATRTDAAPDLLDTLADHYPNGVKFSAADQGEAVKNARGAAAEQMFTTKGEPADQVLKGLHEAGLYPKLETADDLARAMQAAGESRAAGRGPDTSAALELARQQKRTELFQAAALKPRAEAEPLPAQQLFKGDAFKVKGQPRRVTDLVTDPDTGKPAHVEVDGAYGRQILPADAVVHLDKDSLVADLSPRFSLDKNAQPGDKEEYERRNQEDQAAAKTLEESLAGIGWNRRITARSAAFLQSHIPTVGGSTLRAMRAFERAFKRRIVFVESPQRLPFHGASIGALPRTLFLNIRSSLGPFTALGHEFVESLLRTHPDLYQILHDGLRPLMRNEAEYHARLNELEQAEGQQASDAPTARKELIADFVGDQMIKPGFWRKLEDVSPKFFLDVAGAMRDFLGRAVALLQPYRAEKFFTDIERAQKLVSQTLHEFAQRNAEDATDPGTDVRFSLDRENDDRTRQFAEQLRDARDISDALKGKVTNTQYERRPQEDDQAYAARIVSEVGGPEAAIQVFRHEDRLPQPVKMAVGMQILKSLDAAGRHTDAANFFDHDLAPHTTDVAQGLAMLNAWHALSKDGKLDWARLKILRAGKDATDPVRPDIEAAKTELQRQNAAGIERTTADPAVQTAAREAVTDAVANSPETHKGIVMELTEPWASSQFILNTARQHVDAKANELLNKAPRPIGFTPSQYLRSIMDDLAKRAAGIAAGHYQGAEPGVILRDKLQRRLGLTQDAAGRLANALDKEFARQVKAAQDALPKRLARQIERAKQGLPVDATEAAVDRSIRRQLGEQKTNLGQIVREHWTKVDATGRELKDKLVKQAGLDPEAAQKLADLIQKRFEALTARAKAAALEKLLKPLKRLGLAKPQMVEKLVKLSHVGAFDDAKFWNAVKERMNLPEWSGKLKDQLNALADKIGRIPPDRIEELQRAQTEFLNVIERAKGVSNLELGLAFYMQNILSGLTTHVRVAIHTSAQMAAATAAETGRAVVEGRLSDIPLIYQALARGAGRALTQQKDIMRSGLVVGSKLQKVVPLSVLEQIHFGRKGGTTSKQGPIAKAILENRAAGLLNLWKYNSRLITAQHMLYFAPAEEMKVALLAARQARTEGLSGREAVDRARQMLGYGPAQVRAAEAQALREGMEGTRAKMRVAEILKSNLPPAMKETARDYALRQTFLNEPYGFAGAIANLVNTAKQSEHPALATAARVIVPFTRIAANLFNEGLNYTPIGAARARLAKTQLLGQKFADITPETRTDMQRELYAKSALGTMLLTGIALKAAQGLSQPNPAFTVYGAGPSNPQDKAAWRAAGGIPYSAKVGDRYVSYANTPGNVMLAALGNYLDGMRDATLYQRPGAKRLAEDLPMRTAAATMGAGKVILEQPFLQSLVELANMAGEYNAEVSARGAIKTAARTASSFVVPNLLRQADRFYDPTAYDQKSLSGILTSQVPFVRQSGRPLLNALGQPIQSPVFGMFTGPATQDPLARTLTDHNAWPTLPNRNQATVNGVPLSDDEFYLYAKTRGQALADLLNRPSVKTMLDTVAAQSERLNAQAAAAANPVAKAKLQEAASTLQGKVLGKYTAIADKLAEAAVTRARDY